MYRVGILGATGAVGREMIRTLEQRAFPTTEIRLLASARSAGKLLPVRGRLQEVIEVSEESLKGLDIVLASAGGSVSAEWAPVAVKHGAVVIDNTSQFRMDPEAPLVVPEVNPHAIKTHKGIIANPNCSTIQMVVALAPIQKAVGIKRLVISTYQAVSGKGAKAIDECLEQSLNILTGEAKSGEHELATEEFPHQIAFNALPHIDSFLDNGYTKEEMKMVNETHKIFEDDSIGVTATTVRIPVVRGHSESVNVETREPMTAEKCREVLAEADGVIVVDRPGENEYPLAIYADGRDETFVGRIRKDESIENGLNLWIVSDNLRKGAALNAVQIAEEMDRQGLLNQ